MSYHVALVPTRPLRHTHILTPLRIASDIPRALPDPSLETEMC